MTRTGGGDVVDVVGERGGELVRPHRLLWRERRGDTPLLGRRRRCGVLLAKRSSLRDFLGPRAKSLGALADGRHMRTAARDNFRHGLGSRWWRHRRDHILQQLLWLLLFARLGERLLPPRLTERLRLLDRVGALRRPLASGVGALVGGDLHVEELTSEKWQAAAVKRAARRRASGRGQTLGQTPERARRERDASKVARTREHA